MGTECATALHCTPVRPLAGASARDVREIPVPALQTNKIYRWRREGLKSPSHCTIIIIIIIIIIITVFLPWIGPLRTSAAELGSAQTGHSEIHRAPAACDHDKSDRGKKSESTRCFAFPSLDERALPGVLAWW